MITQLRLIHWLKLLELPGDWRWRWRNLADISWFQPPGLKHNYNLTDSLKYLIKNIKTNQITMTTQLRLLHWLKLLELPGDWRWRWRNLADISWFQPPGPKDNYSLTENLKYLIQNIKTNQKTMTTQLRLLHWLKLLELPGDWKWRWRNLADFSWFQPPGPKDNYSLTKNLKYLKQNIKTNQMTMTTQLRLIHWLKLHELPGDWKGRWRNQAHNSWFRRS